MSEQELKDIEYTGDKSDTDRISIKERRKKRSGVAAGSALQENKSMLLLFAVIVAALAVILVSILVLDVPAIPVCIIVFLEAGMALCLHDVPIWLHGLVVIAQVIAGVLCGSTVFILLCAVVYLIGILTLRFIRD